MNFEKIKMVKVLEFISLHSLKSIISSKGLLHIDTPESSAALFRKTRAALLHLPTIEKGKQPMTATEEELDYEIRLPPDVHCFSVHLVLARVMMCPNCPSVLSANTDHIPRPIGKDRT